MPSCRSNFLSGLALSCALASAGAAQSLRVETPAAGAKETGTFSLIFHDAPKRVVVALQWELSIPPAIAVDPSDISTGAGASKAGKSLACAASGGAGGPGRFTCLIAGGNSVLGAGTVAVVRYKLRTDVHGAPIRVTVAKAVGVSADLKKIDLPDADGMLRTR